MKKTGFTKYLVLCTFAVLATIGCAKNERITYYCGTQEGVTCDPNKDSEQDKRLSELEKRLNELEVAFNSNVATVNALSALVSVLDANTYQAQIDSINSQISTLQGQTVVIQSQVTTLTVQENIVEFADPCGDDPGAFDEVILKTSSGKFVAYFESGGDRFLTILSNGSYRTTDNQRCNFTVNGSTISW